MLERTSLSAGVCVFLQFDTAVHRIKNYNYRFPQQPLNSSQLTRPASHKNDCFFSLKFCTTLPLTRTYTRAYTSTAAASPAQPFP